MAEKARRSISESVEGTDTGDFRLFDWGQLVLAASIFGSAFLWIALALRSIDPGAIAFGRVALGAAALAVLPKARRSVARVDRPRLIFAAFFGMAAPALLFALAEERIPSALAGMLISAVPIFAAALVAAATRTWPSRRRLTGLAVGFLGILLLTAPDLGGSEAEMTGVFMVLGAVLAYAVASMLYAPLQQTYGSLPVTMWLLIVSTVMLSPLGIIGLTQSSAESLPLASLLILGVIGSGAAWAMWVGLIGRVGAVRAATAGYIIPIIALVLGVVALDEHIEPIQIAGVLVALAGGYLLSRGKTH